ncbi:MAG: sigma 54-interacting transcriptional regulator [Byssovorax sp.]
MTFFARLAYCQNLGAVDHSSDEVARLRQELDLCRRLLDLGTRDELVPFLEEALGLFVKLAGATRGYIEVQELRTPGDGPRFWIAQGCSEDDVVKIRAGISQGIIAEALATGQTVSTISALEDPRFKGLGSVQRNRIEAVLCAPIVSDSPIGVLYLQGREEPEPFSEEDRLRAETFARHVAAFADRLLLRQKRSTDTDPTLPCRRKLRAEGVIGRSVGLARVLEQVALVARLDITVLLTGPNGTGKTQIARVIHENSPRAAEPFKELNCSAIPEELFESELFGHKRGAFTGADRDQLGLVAAAERGTLFLDEIGDLKLGQQSKLLQFLQSKEYRPVGSSQSKVADVRVLAATNVDLRAAIARREFREDLFFRLQIVPVRVPSLAERPEDIAELAAHFCERACDAYQLPNLRLSAGVLRAMEAAEWPGNVRELAAAVQGAAIRAAGEGVVEIEQRHLFSDTWRSSDPGNGDLTYQEATRRFQAQFLSKVLDDKNWNITETARSLDLARTHIYHLIKGFRLERSKM